MAERRPIYSAQATGQQIGYIEDDEAFDLLDRPCAIYDSNTGLLRNPKNNAVVGYVTLADIFVGSSWMAQELFSKTGPVTPQANLEEQGDEDSEAAVCGAEDGNAQNVDRVGLIVRAPPSHHAAKNERFMAPIPVDSEKASAEEHASHATDITTFASSPQQHKVIDTGLAPPTSPLLGDSATKQPARPQDASDAGKGFASGGPGSGYPSRTMGETAPRCTQMMTAVYQRLHHPTRAPLRARRLRSLRAGMAWHHRSTGSFDISASTSIQATIEVRRWRHSMQVRSH
jgi:hypothetical protein